MSRNDVVAALLERAGGTFAAQAGITLDDKPAPLFRLLMLTDLLSAPIAADLAIGAARELVRSGFGTPRKVADAGWQELVDALGRGHYRRYDESTATRLGENARAVLDRYHGDLRELAEQADGDRERAAELLREFTGIGPTGAAIFLREVQDVWAWVGPYFDERAGQGAAAVGLPRGERELAGLAPRGRRAELAAALVRVTLDDELAAAIRE
ncbi:endonuclease [Nocardia asteroides]|uniref:endonuclease n=1 Tax=Nocardia asteroides TaxID=1824 RepID=UPI001E2B7FD5|nr:endonuclease [Nocardia asteroides]UGT58997.1 endonuclease [Nocardia asteroides]